jgi:hypothetical protein
LVPAPPQQKSVPTGAFARNSDEQCRVISPLDTIFPERNKEQGNETSFVIRRNRRVDAGHKRIRAIAERSAENKHAVGAKPIEIAIGCPIAKHTKYSK